jgi:DDE superfamily endonuclease
VIQRCARAIIKCEALAYSFPNNIYKIREAALEFKKLSTHNLLVGCVGVMDGLLLKIKVPSSREVGNVKSIFSGHYRAYGINIQAACDHRCRFIEVTVASPGGHNDLAAYRKSTLPNIVNNLPVGYYVIGDNAYICLEHLLTSFSGDNRNDRTKDAYNFFVSQLRIRIEMAFGLLTTKWRILRQPLQIRVKNVGIIFMAITRLHNYCINEHINDDAYITNYNRFHPPNNNVNDIDNNRQMDYQPSDRSVADIPGHSLLRTVILEQII